LLEAALKYCKGRGKGVRLDDLKIINLIKDTLGFSNVTISPKEPN
jgi:hypothetical protein